MIMPLRICKILLLGSNAFFLFLIVFNNITDYRSNFLFVENVLNMSTTFEGNNGMWRAIESPLVHHLFYLTIILWETVAMVIVGVGTWKLWKALGGSEAVFHSAKTVGAVGLVVSMLQWYIAFICVGAEWFLMWQSESWNGQEAAMRMFLMMGISLLFLMQKEST
jgi:predicted small integral membrane protein